MIKRTLLTVFLAAAILIQPVQQKRQQADRVGPRHHPLAPLPPRYPTGPRVPEPLPPVVPAVLLLARRQAGPREPPASPAAETRQ